jgi:3-oxoacyl-[acyl-carrier-protein] synthase III
MDTLAPAPLGIAAISIHEPVWELTNGWFGAAMPRKFAHHTGIESRGISTDDEVTMGVQAVRQLQRDTACDLSACRGIVFVSPSFIPPAVARRHLTPEAVEGERTSLAARHVAARLGIPRCRTIGVNWFCCGYSRALEVVTRRWAPRLGLRRDEFVLVVVASRISRITDYGCTQTAGLFGDMATATMLTTSENRKHPVHFDVVVARADRKPVDRPYFDFHLRSHVTMPALEGNASVEGDRLVYALDGMAIAEAAPRAMASATAEALHEAGIAAEDVRFVVPHQAGSGIVRFTGMKLEEHGIRAELINGLTRHTGNVSACSVPHALGREWKRLGGIIACPTAAVGSPGRPEVLQGCVVLRATALHERPSHAAA